MVVWPNPPLDCPNPPLEEVIFGLVIEDGAPDPQPKSFVAAGAAACIVGGGETAVPQASFVPKASKLLPH